MTPDDEGLIAINATDGSKMWFSSLDASGQPTLSRNGSVIYLVTMEEDDTHLISAINACDGSARVVFKITSQMYLANTSPTLSPDESILYVVLGDFLYAMDSYDGVKKWTLNIEGDAGKSGTSVTLSFDGLVAYVCRDGNLYAMNAKDPLQFIHTFR